MTRGKRGQGKKNQSRVDRGTAELLKISYFDAKQLNAKGTQRQQTMTGKFAGKVALITNASTSIGYTVARTLGLAGAKIFLNDNDETRLKNCLEGLKGVNSNIVSYGSAFNLAEDSERTKLVNKIREEMGQLDIAVLGNKPNQIIGDVMLHSEDEFNRVFSNYLTIPFLITKSLVPLIECSRNGSVILLSSIAGYTPFLDIGLYSAAQTGVLGLTKVLAQSLGRKNIRVNSVNLGMFDEDGSGASWSTACGYSTPEAVSEAQNARHHLANLIPLGRTGKAADAVGLIEFLSSDDSKYVTGENMTLSGGISVRV